MGLRTAEEFKAGLRDGRIVYFRGELVDDVTTHPDIGVVAEHVALDFQLAEDPKLRELFTYQNDSGKQASRFFKRPNSSDDLLKRSEMIETSTRLGSGVVLLIKEIGTDALFALSVIAAQVDEERGTDYAERVNAFHRQCEARDVAMAVAQTDAKGDRSLSPSEQMHPDYYVRVVERRDDGIIVRGAKAHTTNTPVVDEIIVLPTRALGEADASYAVSFAVPVNAEGVRLVASPFGGTSDSHFENPVSSRHRMVETLTIFDDVFVPWERVFLCDEWEFAGPLALAFVDFHRFTAVSYKPPLCDLLIGAASVIADYNGISNASHVREKLFNLINYAQTVRALTRAAAHESRLFGDTGLVVPDPITTNVCKYYFATNYHQMVKDVQDIAGGLIVTGPGEEDLENAEIRGDIERFFGGKDVGGGERLRIMNLIRDLCASDFGAYHEVLAIHAEGSLEAQKITIARGFDLARCRGLAVEAVS